MTGPPVTSLDTTRTAPPPAVDRTWGRATVVWCLALLALGGVLAAVADVRVAAWVHGQSFPPAVKTVLRQVRWPGHYGFTVVLAVLIVWPLRQHWRVAAAVLAGGAVGSGVTAVLKFCSGRVRPFHGREAFDWHPFPGSPLDDLITRNLSFPSGDATLAFATAAVVAAALPRWRYAAYGWATLVAVTRVLQGAHYPSDVAAGAVVGIVFGHLSCRVFAVTATPPAAGPRPTGG